MSIVWVTNDPGHNFTDAERYGTLRVLTKGVVDIFNPDRLRRTLEEQLAYFNAAEDLLLLSGAVMTCALSVGVLARDMVSPLKLLVFDAKTRTYVVRHLDMRKEPQNGKA